MMPKLKLWIIIDDQDDFIMAFCRKESAERMLSQMPNAKSKFGLKVREIETVDHIKEIKRIKRKSTCHLMNQ